MKFLKNCIFAVSFVCSMMFFSGTLYSHSDDNSMVMSAYFAEWGVYGREYDVMDIPAEQLTHIVYAFAQIQNGEVAIYDTYAAVEKRYTDLGDAWYPVPQPEVDRNGNPVFNEEGDPVYIEFYGNFRRLNKLKEEHPHIKTLIAIGGWTLSDPFTYVAETDQSRKKFAKSAVEFMVQYGFDGLDIDWEYPGGGGLAAGRDIDRENFVYLMEELRYQLDAKQQEIGKSEPFLLTVASPAGEPMERMELGSVAQYIDWFHLMAYDYHGAWENLTNHQAALYFNDEDPSGNSAYVIDYSVNYYLNQGVAASQIVLGIPLYARGWSGIPEGEQGGLFARSNKASGFDSAGTWENGILDYNDVFNKINSNPSYQVYRDYSAGGSRGQSWVYSSSEEGGVFYAYDDADTVKDKVEYIQSLGLRGAMFWELSGDIRDQADGNKGSTNPNHPESIIGTVYRGLFGDL